MLTYYGINTGSTPTPEQNAQQYSQVMQGYSNQLAQQNAQTQGLAGQYNQMLQNSKNYGQSLWNQLQASDQQRSAQMQAQALNSGLYGSSQAISQQGYDQNLYGQQQATLGDQLAQRQLGIQQNEAQALQQQYAGYQGILNNMQGFQGGAYGQNLGAQLQSGLLTQQLGGQLALAQMSNLGQREQSSAALAASTGQARMNSSGGIGSGGQPGYGIGSWLPPGGQTGGYYVGGGGWGQQPDGGSADTGASYGYGGG